MVKPDWSVCTVLYLIDNIIFAYFKICTVLTERVQLEMISSGEIFIYQ